jgi:hypothetical protein
MPLIVLATILKFYPGNPLTNLSNAFCYPNSPFLKKANLDRSDVNETQMGRKIKLK